MNDILSGIWQAGALIFAFDAGLFEIVLLSLQVTLTAVVIASFIGMPLGAWLAVNRFKLRRFVIAVLNALMGLPPVVVGLVVLAAVLGVTSLVAIWHVGAWNLVFPNRHHDTVAPEVPTGLAPPAILVFSKTNGFRHKEGIAGGLEEIESIAGGNSWSLFHTENGAVFNAGDLAPFDAVIFLNASGDMLNEAQESAFKEWLAAGGGWLGIHAAGDSSHLDWQWYRDK